jgi:hypothetical protein
MLSPVSLLVFLACLLLLLQVFSAIAGIPDLDGFLAATIRLVLLVAKGRGERGNGQMVHGIAEMIEKRDNRGVRRVEMG